MKYKNPDNAKILSINPDYKEIVDKEKIIMDDTLFNELLESVQEAGEIMRGEKNASRTFEYGALRPNHNS
jgi:stalled ribosome rescue protein Dom34